MTLARRLLVVAALVAGPLFLAASPARALVTGGCNGSATIKGVTYTPANDTPGNPVLIPNEKGVMIPWEATTGGPITDHHGQIGVNAGPFVIPVAKWAGENADKKTKDADTYSLDSAYEKIPVRLVGLYRVSGFHTGTGGDCEGFVYVRFEGNPLATVPGILAVGLTGGAVVLVGVGGFRKRI